MEDDFPVEHFTKDEVIEKEQSMAKTWTWTQGQLTAVNKRTSSMVAEARSQTLPRKKLIFEVYSGDGLLGPTLEQMGAEVMRFGLNNGWDFTQASHHRSLLRLIDELEPDEIYLSPKCTLTLWSQMQAINVRTDEDWEDLQERRHYDHDMKRTSSSSRRST